MKWLDIFDKYIPRISQAIAFVLIVFSIIKKYYYFSIPLTIIFITILYFSLRIKKDPVCFMYNKTSLIIRNESGKLVHVREKSAFRVNYPHFKKIVNRVCVDGSIQNISGTICSDGKNDDSIKVMAFSSYGKEILVDQRFSNFLKMGTKYTKNLEFDIIDSYTNNQEYHTFDVNSYHDIFTFSILFPPSRYPISIECFDKKDLSHSHVPIENLIPLTIFIDSNGYKEYNWEIKKPPVGISYKVQWTW